MKPKRAFPAAGLATLFLVLAACAAPSNGVRYDPPAGQGPLVLMISGKSGPGLYGEFAKRLAASGYRVVLFDGNDFPINHADACREKILDIIKNHSSAVSPGTAVVGYSLGGAVAFSCAASAAENISAVVAYYPATAFIPDRNACVDGLRVPVLILQGEDDSYLDCCRVETIREMVEKAREKGRKVELVVYPDAGHGFNLGPLKNKNLDTDSWRRTLAALKRYLPEEPGAKP